MVLDDMDASTGPPSTMAVGGFGWKIRWGIGYTYERRHIDRLHLGRDQAQFNVWGVNDAAQARWPCGPYNSGKDKSTSAPYATTQTVSFRRTATTARNRRRTDVAPARTSLGEESRNGSRDPRRI
jgi:hypothetical protein